MYRITGTHATAPPLKRRRGRSVLRGRPWGHPQAGPLERRGAGVPHAVGPPAPQGEDGEGAAGGDAPAAAHVRPPLEHRLLRGPRVCHCHSPPPPHGLFTAPHFSTFFSILICVFFLHSLPPFLQIFTHCCILSTLTSDSWGDRGHTDELHQPGDGQIDKRTGIVG